MKESEIATAVVEFASEYGLGKTPEFKHLYNSITSSARRERYFGLMRVFSFDIREQRTLIQTFAGRLLLKIKPKPFESCEEALFRLLPHWDVSAEEVIYYLREQFGKPTVLSAVANLKLGKLSERELAQLETVVYWLGGNER